MQQHWSRLRHLPMERIRVEHVVEENRRIQRRRIGDPILALLPIQPPKINSSRLQCSHRDVEPSAHIQLAGCIEWNIFLCRGIDSIRDRHFLIRSSQG